MDGGAGDRHRSPENSGWPWGERPRALLEGLVFSGTAQTLRGLGKPVKWGVTENGPPRKWSDLRPALLARFPVYLHPDLHGCSAARRVRARRRMMSQAATALQITACATTAHCRNSDTSGCRIGVISQFPACAATKSRMPIVQSSVSAFALVIDTPAMRANDQGCAAWQSTGAALG